MADLALGATLLAVLLFAIRGWIRAAEKSAEAEADRADAVEASETQRRITDATRDVPAPDVARERLRRFSGDGPDYSPDQW